MKRLLISLFLAATGIAWGEDSLTITRVVEGWTPTNEVMADVKGRNFEQVRPRVERILQALGNTDAWNDFGPDASHMSAAITIDGKAYVIKSWYPLHRDDERIAVSEKSGLVSVSGKVEKAKIEGQNSERYRTLVSIFDLYKSKAPQQGAAPLPSAPQAGPSEGAR